MNDEYDVNNMSDQQPTDEKKRSHNAMGICVVLEDDMAKCQIEDLLLAIKQLRGVETADWIDHDFDTHCNRIRMKVEFKEQLKKGLEF